MANPKQAVTSLLTEHFQHTPLTLLDDIINTVNEVVYRAVTAIEEGLSAAPPSSLGFPDIDEPSTPPGQDEDGNPLPAGSAAQSEIDHGVHQLETLLQATVDKNFDKLEIFVLRNVLSVDEELLPWLRLSHYEGLDPVVLNESSASDTTQPPRPTPESLIKLRRKLTETRKLNAALLAERARNEALISQLRAILTTAVASQSAVPTPASLAFISSTPSAAALGVSFANPIPLSSSPPRAAEREQQRADLYAPLTTKVRESLAHLPELKALLASLNPKTVPGALAYSRRRDPAAEERREYIETQIRRRFEREGRDISGDAERKEGVEIRDVAALEGIAAILGSAQAGGVQEEDGQGDLSTMEG